MHPLRRWNRRRTLNARLYSTYSGGGDICIGEPHDPLGQYLAPEPFPASVPEGEYTAEARGFYCGTIAAEFMHINNPEQRQWLQEKMEQTPPKPDQKHILTRLIHADLFEQVIQSRYLGTKRFSLEGLTVLIPFLDQVLASSSGSSARHKVHHGDEPPRPSERDDEYHRSLRKRALRKV